MSTMTFHIEAQKTRHTSHLPKTARGRALHTVSWFLNGTAPYINFDQSQIRIKEVNHVYV
jgi:hypothetical protein